MSGSTRRLLLARTGRELEPGGQRLAEWELGWSRVTVRKGLHELTSGITCVEAYVLHGCKKAEGQLPRFGGYSFAGPGLPAGHRPSPTNRARL